MKRKIALILASILLLLVFGAVFSIDVAQIKGKDSKDPENTTPPSTTVPDVEEPPREIETSLDNLLRRYLTANRIYPDVVYIGDDVNSFVASMNSTIVDTNHCLDEVDEGSYLELSSDSFTGEVYEERSVSYGSDIILSFSVVNGVYGDDPFDGKLTLGLKTSGDSGSIFTLDIAKIFDSGFYYFNGDFSFPIFGFKILDSKHEVAMHISTSGGYVDYYIDRVYVGTLDLSAYSGVLNSEIVSGFYFRFESKSDSLLLDSISVSVPSSVYGECMPKSPESLDHLLADGFEKDFTLDFTAGAIDDVVVTTSSSGNFQTSYTTNGLLIEAAKSDALGVSASVIAKQLKSYPDFFVVDYVLSLADSSPDIVMRVGSVDLLYIAPDGRLKLLTSPYGPVSSNQIGKEVEYDKTDDGSLRLSLNVNLETNLVDLYVNETLAYSNFYRYFYTGSNRNVVNLQVYSHQEDLTRSVILESVSVFSKALN